MKYNGYQLVCEEINTDYETDIGTITDPENTQKQKNKAKAIIAGMLVTGALAIGILLARRRIKNIRLSKLADEEKAKLIKLETDKLSHVAMQLKYEKVNENRILWALYKKYLPNKLANKSIPSPAKLKRPEFFIHHIKDSFHDKDWNNFVRDLTQKLPNKYAAIAPAPGSKIDLRSMRVSNADDTLGMARSKVKNIKQFGLANKEDSTIIQHAWVEAK